MSRRRLSRPRSFRAELEDPFYEEEGRTVRVPARTFVSAQSARIGGFRLARDYRRSVLVRGPGLAERVHPDGSIEAAVPSTGQD